MTGLQQTMPCTLVQYTKRGDPEADKERFHPAVLTNPVTGNRSLDVNPTYTMRLDGMNEEDSRPISERRDATAPGITRTAA